MSKTAALLCCLLLIGIRAKAQNAPADSLIPKRQYTTRRLSSPIRLDGRPDEAAWAAVPWSEAFIQHTPTEGARPSQQSHFKVLYDDKHLYLAYQCLDSAPKAIVRRMGRRDDFPGDWIEVNIDSYHDLRTGFSFTLSASGVRGDEAISLNGNNWDGSWNPIWYAKTHVNDSGWTGEIKIPFSQLRYSNDADKVWGLQVQRMLFRKDERSFWQFIPQATGAWVSGFGELRGLNGIPAQKQVEIAPYIVAQTARYQQQEGNPFATGTDNRLSGGVDGKVAVTSNLILDFTVNPDFGQVEADPSQVRIDGYQNFFGERRPFFVEGRSIFDYQLTGSAAGGNYDQDLLFYSRRIGGRPHGYPALGAGEWAKLPDNTAILGATKLSGKTQRGWSIGVLESITRREFAEIDRGGERREEVAEPLTSYFVGRVMKDIHEGKTVLGGIFTAVNREAGLDGILHKSAYSGGLDFLHYWRSRSWYYRGNVVLSRVEGTPQAIYSTQTSFEHLFQRSNITEVSADTSRTALTGTGGTFKIGKSGGTPGRLGQLFRFETGVTWRSPQLELNDIGFMLSANEINYFAWGGYVFQKPFAIFRNGRVSYNHWARWDFGGQLLYVAFNINQHAQFRNLWSYGVGLDWNPYEVSNNALRGGSSMRKPAGMGSFAYLNSNPQKKLTGNLNYNSGWGFRQTVHYRDYSMGMQAQPVNAFNVNLSAGYTDFYRKGDQYVDEVRYNGQPRSIVSEVSQQTLRLTLRLNYNITPDLTVQYYGQPFITRPLYDNYGYVVDPLNADYDSRFHRYTPAQLSYANDRYSVDENGDGQADYSFARPDFNFVQFRSNLVLRWEYRPGSELYLVWSEGATPDVARDLNSPLQSSLYENLFNQQARNIFLVKATYRFLR